jgi:hypothetical protein
MTRLNQIIAIVAGETRDAEMEFDRLAAGFSEKGEMKPLQGELFGDE